MLEEKGARCCYAESDKHWATDPQNVIWEMFRTMNESAIYGNDRGLTEASLDASRAESCCSS